MYYTYANATTENIT